MEDNSQQVQFHKDSPVYKFLNNAELARALADINLDALKRVGEEFQSGQHNIMLAINPGDKETAALAIAVCRGANDFVYWIEAVKLQMQEIEIAGKAG